MLKKAIPIGFLKRVRGEKEAHFFNVLRKITEGIFEI
jgi:hypothetical protein